MTISERIVKRRKELGLTQEELAKKMGYSGKSIISKTENKKNDIQLNTISKFAKALDCTEGYLMGWEEVPDVADVSDHVKLITLYNKLTDEQKKIVMSLMESMIN